MRPSLVSTQTRAVHDESPSPYNHYSLKDDQLNSPSSRSDESNMEPDSAVLHRSLQAKFLRLSKGSGIRLLLEGGGSIIDASGGASVACIGHGDARVRDAIVAQLDKVAYCATTFYTTGVCEDLCRELVDSTHGQMSRAYIVSSGE
jgi:adenosylmethionine-8-amino-7-oxononanoate aminotransferase